MKLALVEPLRELFKDEVRKIGRRARPAYEMVYRHPFPGPGLGVRILGEVEKEYPDYPAPARRDLHRRAARPTSCTTKVSQAFVGFLPQVGRRRRRRAPVRVRGGAAGGRDRSIS